MEIGQDKKDALRAFLSQLGESQLVLLVSAMDYARSHGAEDIPYEFILSVLRPTLFRIRPPRNGTAQRILCNPFEDLLIPRDPKVKKETMIARASLQPVWEWLQAEGGTAFQEICNKCEKALTKEDLEKRWEAQVNLWQAAVELMQKALQKADESAANANDLLKKLGGSTRLEDMEEMSHVLSVAPELETLKKKLPVKPISKFLDGHITSVKNCYNDTADSQPGEESWIIVAAMRRLLKQADILKVVKSISPDGDDSIVAISDLAKVGDVVIGDLEELVQQIDAMASEGGTEETLLGLIKEYVKTFEAITMNLNIRRDGAWGQRLFTTRKVVSDALTRTILAQAPEKLKTALKQRSVKAGRTKRTISDLRADLDPEAYRMARSAARSMKESLRIADKIGMMSNARSVANGMVDQLEKFSDQLLEDIHTVPADYKKRARDHVIMIAHLMEFLVDSEQADFFLRRAMRRIDESEG
ncbi:hypothetical protein [Curvivirga aplysinae]|uniref:hypothetical protein n=1 Tax=Curvivirga aplysinae TaxID=2529852 RepID=UPI0012BD1A31|nr:hypothetical protein [Curvivirga aplysinae]MTI10117.1 hypothetical protein [Curvivirga aplysinae]